MPASDPSNSAPTITMRANPIPSFSPVKIAGSAPGHAIVVNRSTGRAP